MRMSEAINSRHWKTDARIRIRKENGKTKQSLSHYNIIIRIICYIHIHKHNTNKPIRETRKLYYYHYYRDIIPNAQQ